MTSDFDYGLVRFTDQPRITRGEFKDFTTVAAHLYRGTYYPGSLPRADYPTTGRVTVAADALRFSLRLEQPDMAALLAALPTAPRSFWETDFVSLNFVDRQQRVVQVAAKPTGETGVFRGYEAFAAEVTAAVAVTDDGWTAEFTVPLTLLGTDAADLAARPLPFDCVRYTQANGAITSWCPIPNQLPFNENYVYPVFCFGLLANGDAAWADYAGAADLGAWTYTGPESIPAGAFVRFGLTYTAGPRGLAPGGSLRFVVQDEVLECNRKSPVMRRFPEKDWTPLQWTEPGAPGYVTARCSRPGVELALRRDLPFSTTVELVAGGSLAPGDTIAIGVGTDPAGPGVRCQQLTKRELPFKCFVDVAGTGVYRQPGAWPTVRIRGGAAQAFQVNCPPTPDPGETVRLVVAATDYVGNLADGYRGTVRFFCAGPLEGLPETYTFTAADDGVAQFAVRFAAAGAFTVEVVDVDRPECSGTSHLVVTDGSFGPGKIYFGDIHTHSQNSDGRLHPAEKAREVGLHRGLDFWALTDHCHDLTPTRVALLEEVTESCNRDHEFVTIPAYEWTNSMGQGKPVLRRQYGHRNVYLRQPLRQVFDGVDPRSDSPRKLAAAWAAAGEDVVIHNHFHCGDPAYEPDVDDGVEISGWCGNFVKDDNGDRKIPMFKDTPVLVRNLFDRAASLGVVAGTDHGSEAYHAGLPAELAAVYAPELTRDAVFAALKTGATYATSGQKTLLRVTAGDRTLRVVVGSVTPVLQVEVFRNGQVWQSIGGEFPGGVVHRWEFRDDGTGSGWYWVRLRTAQGHWTWSSPVYY